MKEAFWGVFIILLGAIGIVAINLFQDLTVTTDQNYYLMKEATKAAMEDSLDLSYYRSQSSRQIPRPRIVKEAFVENLTRRFASSAVLNKDYTIIIHDIVEQPPKVSLSLVSNAKDIKGGKYDVLLNIDSIYEGIYGKNVTFGDDKFPFPIIGEDPETVIIPGEDPKIYPDDGKCPNFGGEVVECISGDLQFVGWGSIPAFKALCPEDFMRLKAEKRDAKYKECVCGKWEEPKTETITASPVRNGLKSTYTWLFKKDGPINDINEQIKYVVSAEECVIETAICSPGSEINLLIGEQTKLEAKYNPTTAANRNLSWSVNNDYVTVLGQTAKVRYPNVDRAIVTAKKPGTSIVTATSSNFKSSTCKINVFDSTNIECPKIPVTVYSENIAYAELEPDIKFPNMVYSISNENIAKIDQKGLIRAEKITVPVDITYTVKIGTNIIKTCPLHVRVDNPIPKPSISERRGCRAGDIIDVSWAVGAANVCPQAKDISDATFIDLALSGSELTVKGCGFSSPFESDCLSSWDKSISIPLGTSSGTNYTVKKSISNYNETSGNYSVDILVGVNNDGWQENLIKYNCRSSGVVQFFRTKISGRVLSREASVCKNFAANLGDTRNEANAVMDCTAPYPGLTGSPSSLSFTSIPGDVVNWTIMDGEALVDMPNKTGKDVILTAKKGTSGGSVTLNAKVTNKGNFIFEKTCTFNIEPDACEGIEVKANRSCIRYADSSGVLFEMKNSDGTLSQSGNALWTSSPNLIPLGGNSSTNSKKYIPIPGVLVDIVTTGTVTVQRQAKCLTDNSYSRDSASIKIHPKDDYYCDTIHYPIKFSETRCRTLSSLIFGGKKPECSPNQVSYGGNCYNQSDMPAATHVEAKCPSGSTLMCAGGSAQGCSYYFCGTTTKSKVASSCKDKYYYYNRSCYKYKDSMTINECKAEGSGATYYNKQCYHGKDSTKIVYVCPSGTVKNAVDGKCYNTTDIQNAYYHCTRGTETGYMIYNKCIYQTTKKELPTYCDDYGPEYAYDPQYKTCYASVPAKANDCKQE